jgi:hypothetical protein
VTRFRLWRLNQDLEFLIPFGAPAFGRDGTPFGRLDISSAIFILRKHEAVRSSSLVHASLAD